MGNKEEGIVIEERGKWSELRQEEANEENEVD